MKAPEPRHVGIGQWIDGGFKLTIIAQDWSSQELPLTLEVARKLAEDLLFVTMDLDTQRRATQLCNKEPDMFTGANDAAEASIVRDDSRRNQARR